MRNIWKKHKASLIIIGYIIIVTSFIYFIFMPFINEIKEKSDLIQEKNIDNQMRKASLDTVPDMEKDYNNFLANSATTDVILNSSDEVVFIKKLESLAEQTGNTINLEINDQTAANGTANKLSSTAAKNTEKTIKDTLAYNKYISMKIDLEGNYPSLLNYINKLENDNYYVNVLSIYIQKKTVTPDNVSQTGPTPGNNIFSAGNQPSQPNSSVSQEILDSTLTVIIYLKN